MLKNQEAFQPSGGKRRILVVDDEMINRELLRNILEEEYEVLLAPDGQEGLRLVREYKGGLSLVLLDLMMPVLSGTEMLQRMKDSADTAQIPVIVLTSDQTAEIECLDLGAIDFIPKPYPQAGVILARVRRTIELSEDRDIIRSTERDPLTGLYNREYFYRYAKQFDQFHQDVDMDAIVVDIFHFHLINERFGTAHGDDILRRVGERLRETAHQAGGIICRQEADTFLIYCPHQTEYEALLGRASAGLDGKQTRDSQLRLRMGVYSTVDKAMDIERRFDRAKAAADSVRASVTKTIAIYDKALHEKELYEEQLVENFAQAIREEQFKVYYQPKFAVQPSIPVLSSAEALVRWAHPTLGMISPGIFIPLFEENGLIQELDTYVWEHAAAQMKEWKEKFGFSVPVSVNVSRIDMYDPQLLETIQGILRRHGLTPGDMLLEITESAYTQDSRQIIDTVQRLRQSGFKIEMDDFGTGYSSLNMISALPLDALKLDMQFIRSAFRQRKDTRLLEIILDIADYLSVPVIAEGVETQEQLDALRAMGCDIVQGYYFSKPLPAGEYERFVADRARRDSALDRDAADPVQRAPKRARKKEGALGSITQALSCGFESIYYVDVSSDRYVVFTSEGRYEDLQIQRSGENFFRDTQQIISRLVFPDDQARLALSLQKEALLAQLIHDQPFSMTYRLVLDGAPVYYHLKAVKVDEGDGAHVVIGVSQVSAQAEGAAPHANPLDFQSLARALSADMESIYYVDLDTDSYMEFTTGSDNGALKLEISGQKFFDECRRNISSVIFEEDRGMVAQALDKQTLLGALSARPSFLMDYRLLIDGAPRRYRLKATIALDGGRRHLIIGVCSVEGQPSGPQSQSPQGRSAAYSRIAQALAADYFSIYYVDTRTDRFIEYSSHEEYQELNIEKGGEDFFALSRRNIQRVVHPEDRERVTAVMQKEFLMKALAPTGFFTQTYRILFSEGPIYVHMKASLLENNGETHLVIGVSSVDDQMKREQEYERQLAYAREAANRDPLTGVKSKHAFVEAEERWNQALRGPDPEPFALAICDVNGLKTVNDTLGHKAGDDFIRRACSVICNVFKHSPVYRIGGDEFAAILYGQDYERRADLYRQVTDMNRDHTLRGDVVIACGMADFEPGRDRSFAAVFERADAHMYENKSALKTQG